MSASTGQHILLIHCSVSDQSQGLPVPFRGAKIYYNYDVGVSQATAFRILDAALVQPFLQVRWQPTMAVLVFPTNHGVRQIYSLPNIAGASIYVASSDIVDGGSVLHDAMSANILRLADTTDNAVFPYEMNSIKPHLVSTKRHVLDEFNDRDINLDEGFKGVAMSPTEIGQLNECRRTNFLHAGSVTWPALLPDANGASDILCIRWKGTCGTLYASVPLGGGVDPVWMGSFEIALVSAKDSFVYYYKKNNYYNKCENITEPTNRVMFEFKRIKELHSRTPQPSQ